MFFWVTAAVLTQAQVPTNPITQDRLDQPKPPVVTPQPSAGRTNVQAAGSAEPIRTIVFRGVDAPARVANAARAFVGKRASRPTLVELAAALSRAYEGTDVALYT